MTNVYVPAGSVLTSVPFALLRVITNASFLPTAPSSLGWVIAGRAPAVVAKTTAATAAITDETATRFIRLLCVGDMPSTTRESLKRFVPSEPSGPEAKTREAVFAGGGL